MSKHTPAHIPGYRSTPRTLSQAQRRAEADSIIDAVRRAKAPALGAQALASAKAARRARLWAAAVILVIAGVFGFFAAHTNPIAALAATAICSGVIGMCVVAIAVRRAELVESWDDVAEEAEE